MSLLALTKLLYLGEWLSLQRFAEPLTGDELVSMQHGPALSRTLDLTLSNPGSDSRPCRAR
jgi:uncharacterized phage-associated protein